MKKAIILFFVVSLFLSCKKDKSKPESVGLVLEGKTYETLVFDGQEWTTENYDGSKGVYYNGIKTIEGKLVDLHDIQSIAKTLPNNWRLPTIRDYIRMIKASGGDFKNESASTYSDYDIIDEELDDKALQNLTGGIGFNVKLAGVKNQTAFSDRGNFTFLWTSTIIPPSANANYYLPIALGVYKINNISSAYFAEFPQPIAKITDNSRESGSLRLVRDL